MQFDSPLGLPVDVLPANTKELRHRRSPFAGQRIFLILIERLGIQSDIRSRSHVDDGFFTEKPVPGATKKTNRYFSINTPRFFQNTLIRNLPGNAINFYRILRFKKTELLVVYLNGFTKINRPLARLFRF